jgi:hypothetical protein
MAGSWDHITTGDGKFRSESFTDLIENLDDAHEAAEECFGMVWWLAWQLAEIGDRAGEPSREDTLGVIAEAVQFCKDGLAAGGTEED